jgi:hypothetical protein
MMKKKIYIVSHSSIDLVSVLNLYERYRRQCDVTIVISGTEENLRFLQSVDVPESALRFLNFESRNNKNKKRLARYLRQLLAEKRMLDELITEISVNSGVELFFHSYDNDPQAGYLAARVAETNRVTLVDVLGMKPKPLNAHGLFSWIGIKNMLYLVIINFVFGRLFMLSGTRSCPLLSLNLGRVKIANELKSVRTPASHLAEYRYPISGNGRKAVFLYADSFGISEQQHASINREVVDCLVRIGLNIHVKIHPQSRPPDFLDDCNVRYIPQYVPFEFVDLTNVSLVIGLAGASLLCTEGVPTVSLLRLMYPMDSDLYVSAMTQTSQNPAIVYVSSVDELENVVAGLG